jgi:hypothetical protein
MGPELEGARFEPLQSAGRSGFCSSLGSEPLAQAPGRQAGTFPGREHAGGAREWCAADERFGAGQPKKITRTVRISPRNQFTQIGDFRNRATQV